VVHAVNAVEHGLLLVVDRRRDDDGLGPSVEEGLERRAREELAGALEDEVDAVQGDLGGGVERREREREREEGGKG